MSRTDVKWHFWRSFCELWTFMERSIWLLKVRFVIEKLLIINSVFAVFLEFAWIYAFHRANFVISGEVVDTKLYWESWERFVSLFYLLVGHYLHFRSVYTMGNLGLSVHIWQQSLVPDSIETFLFRFPGSCYCSFGSACFFDFQGTWRIIWWHSWCALSHFLWYSFCLSIWKCRLALND